MANGHRTKRSLWKTAAWAHEDGKGLNVQLVSGLAVSGRLVLREYTVEDEKREKKVERN